MTDTDRIYVAVLETMKKYSPEQAMEGLNQYITSGNANYFTSSNGARESITKLEPVDVLKDILKSIVKSDMVIRNKGYATVLPNTKLVDSIIADYKSGEVIRDELSTGDLQYMISKLVMTDLNKTLDVLGSNEDIFKDTLALSTTGILNYRKELNGIPDSYFENVNLYFEKIKNNLKDKQR